MGRAGHIPYRTCLVCRSRRPKASLLRLAVDDRGEVVPDPRQDRPGRGAYVCSACLGRLTFDRRVQRAFRGRAVRFSRTLEGWMEDRDGTPADGGFREEKPPCVRR
ncbi:YlxR family protein [Desulfacinum infernum]|uniref:YlxR family protein n=1 Tax=Desulfacinum infernum TaxID=35837 RepID=UPI00093384FD|nr:YlxR family protein [Desulfacinum infernum]